MTDQQNNNIVRLIMVYGSLIILEVGFIGILILDAIKDLKK